MQRPQLITAALSIALPFMSWAQPRAASCFFTADFEHTDALDGWDLGPLVERQTPEGDGLGEFVPAWMLGDAYNANSAQYFPVLDQPFGNRFVMTNDAAPPCNCDMSDVSLTSPVIDLSGRSNAVLECRVFNEGILGAGVAHIETTSDDENWQSVAEIPALMDEWQWLTVDLSDLDGSGTMRFRFRWSDGSNWAGGFAVDDVCLRERLTHDLTLMSARTGDATVSAFLPGDQTLAYRQLPLEQAGAIQVTAALKNTGTEILRHIQAHATLVFNGAEHGPFASAAIDSLMPGSVVLAPITTGWTPDATGTVHVNVTAASEALDDDASDNDATSELQITGTGWDAGYSAMARDFGPAIGSIGSIDPFTVANRMEMTAPGSHAFGISAELHPSTEAGAVVRALLMDGNFSFLDTSMRRTLSQADIDGIQSGTPLYFSLVSAPTLPQGDVWVALQRLEADGPHMAVNVGGDSPLGSSALLEGIAFTLSYLHSTPMVRLHLSEMAVGISGTGTAIGPMIYPSPANDVVHVTLPASTTGTHPWWITDAAGRTVRSGFFGAQQAHQPHSIDVSDLVPGMYLLVTPGNKGPSSTARLVVSR